jgi:3-isopropylmalate/(R)-2-methylmalate dehydratase small subunit
MPLVTVPGIVNAVERWDDVQVDWREARVTVSSSGQVLEGKPLSDRAIKVISAGGGYNLLLAEHNRKAQQAALQS